MIALFWIPSDSTLTILKYSGSALAALYGVYATLVEFKKEKEGRKVLTRSGFIGIAFLIVVSGVGLLSDRFKDIKDRAENANTAANQAKVSDMLQRQLDSTKALNAELQEQYENNNRNFGKIEKHLPPTLRERTAKLVADLQKFIDTWRKDAPDYSRYANLPDAQDKYAEAISASQKDMLSAFKDSNLAVAVTTTVQDLQKDLAFNNRQCGPASMGSLRDIDDCKGALKLALIWLNKRSSTNPEIMPPNAAPH
jgi:hypothetical protein